MEKSSSPLQKGDNGSVHQLSKLGTKNRLRIHGTAVLERENHPNITATYDYSTACPNNFFEEDVSQLKYFELNKIALGMTIYKNEDSPTSNKKLSSLNGHHKNGTNGLKNGSSMMLEKYDPGKLTEPLLTDVIWSRMDMTNPMFNPNAYIIKQYYKPDTDVQKVSHGERCNNFMCGFISCCVMIAIGCILAFYSKELYKV